MLLTKKKNYTRRDEQPLPLPRPSRIIVDCLLCQQLVDSELGTKRKSNHEEPDPKLPGQSRIQHFIAGTYMGHKLVVPGPSERHIGRVYREGMTDEEAFM